jgi:hypothetical protein
MDRPIGNAMWFQKHRPQSRALALGYTPALNHRDKHLDEGVDWISLAIDTLSAGSALRRETHHRFLVYFQASVVKVCIQLCGMSPPGAW